MMFIERKWYFILCMEAIHSFISIQPWRPGLAGTRAQSCDWYGSGTLHPGKVLGGSLPLLSPAFRRSHFSRQMPLSAMTREILAVKGGTVARKMSGSNFCLNSDFHANLGIFYMPQIYDMGPTALLPLWRKACWGFFRPKNPTASAVILSRKFLD